MLILWRWEMDGTGSVLGFDVKGRRAVSSFAISFSYYITVTGLFFCTSSIILLKRDEQGIGGLLYLVSSRRKSSGHIFHTYNCFQDQQIPFKVLCFCEFNGLDPWMTVDRTATLPISVSAYVSVCLCAWVSPSLYVCLSVSLIYCFPACLTACVIYPFVHSSASLLITHYSISFYINFNV